MTKRRSVIVLHGLAAAPLAVICLSLTGCGDSPIRVLGPADQAVSIDLFMNRPDLTAVPDLAADPLSTDDDHDGVSENDGDCDDSNPDIYPGSMKFIEGVDYDCEGRRKFMATIVITCDDAYELCVNGKMVGMGMDFSNAETYQVILKSGDNVIAAHGYDIAGVTSGLAAYVTVAGQVIRTDGVLAKEPDATGWRYYPHVMNEPDKATWCSVAFDDTTWGPALFSAEQDDGAWLYQPLELRSLGTEWIWDGMPTALKQSWFRRRVKLPDALPVHAPAPVKVCKAIGQSTSLTIMNQYQHNGVALIWDGHQYAAAWDQFFAAWGAGVDETFLQTISATGARLGQPVRMTTGTWWNSFPRLQFGAGVYAVVDEDGRNNRDFDQIYASISDGKTLSAEVAYSKTSTGAKKPSIGFDGTNFGIAWQDDRDGGAGAYEIYFGRMAPGGAAVGSPLRVTNSPGSSRIPSLAWDSTEWAVAWEDVRDQNFEIYFATISAQGVKQGADVRVTMDPAWSSAPSLAWSGSAFGLAWEDERDGNSEIYFTTITPGGVVGPAVRVTTDGGVSTDPRLIWDKNGWTLVWREGRDGNDEVYAARLDKDGKRLTDESRISQTAGHSWHPDVAFNGTDYGVIWEEESDPVMKPYQFQAWFSRFECP